MSFRFGLARCMLLKPSPFSPMDKRESSEEEEVSGDRPDAAEEEPDPEGKKERKARLVTAQTGKRRRRKKRSIRDGLRQVGRGADRRLRRVLLDHRHRNLGEDSAEEEGAR